MKHKYNYYDKAELLTNPKIAVTVMEDNNTVFRSIAAEMVEEIKRKNALGEKTVFICPVGPVGQYPYFVETVNKEKISLKDVYFINMDEYLSDDGNWIEEESKLSFRGFMNRVVYSEIDADLVMPESQRIFPDPKNPDRIEEVIRELGGVDICFGGIGINGHVAFNEADKNLSNEEYLAQKTRVLEVSRETRVTNAIMDLNGAIEDMPKHCVTIGISEIYGARKIRLACFRDWHRAVVRRAAHGEQTSDFPVSLLQSHADISLKITEFVANLEG